MKNITLFLALLLAVDVAAAADAANSGSKPSVPAKAPHGGMMTKPGTGHPQGQPGAIPADTRLINSGKVLDVLDSEMYTYLLVTSDNGPLWLAAYKTTVAKGATVRYSGGVGMPNFFSKALNRSFDLIVFVDTLEVSNK